MPTSNRPRRAAVKVFNMNSLKIYTAVSMSDTHITLKPEAGGNNIKVRIERCRKLYAEYSKKAYEQFKAAKEARAGIVESPSPDQYKWEDMVLHDGVYDNIQVGLSRVMNHEAIDAVWNISRIDPMPKSALNFFGPPGTGKTQSARCIAAQLGKKLMIVDYSAAINGIVGETGSAIADAFRKAAETDCILFFDEADSLVSKRMSSNSFNPTLAQSMNAERNTLMQELDRFEGIVIFATNLFTNFDEAMLRRFAMHVEFKRPDQAMRRKLFEKHITRHDLLEPDVNLDEVAKATKGLAGGDVLQITINAINMACQTGAPETWRLGRRHLMSQVDAVFRAKEAHSGKRKRKTPEKPLISTVED